MLLPIETAWHCPVEREVLGRRARADATVRRYDIPTTVKYGVINPITSRIAYPIYIGIAIYIFPRLPFWHLHAP